MYLLCNPILSWYSILVLRVVDQEQEAIPPTPWNSRDPAAVEGDDMVGEDVRGQPNKEFDDGTSTKKNTDNRPNIVYALINMVI